MIQAKDLRYAYDDHEVLKGLDFRIREGELYGLLGPNGAGKTTTISILSSILQPSSGEVTIGGHNVASAAKEVKRLIGVVPQEIALYTEMTAAENLYFWGRLYHVPRKELAQRSAELLRAFGLYDRRNDKVKSYSGGMKRRINIAASLLHRPAILFMDEPTVGIDPQSRNLIFETVERLHAEGMTIVYTTHYMEEAERLCDRIGIIDRGNIIAEGTLAELKGASTVKETISITFSDPGDGDPERIGSFWSDFSAAGDTVHFHSSQARSDLPKVVLHCHEQGLGIKNIEIQQADLETIFLDLTGRQLRD